MVRLRLVVLEIQLRWGKVIELEGNRTSLLQKELARQTANDTLRREFARLSDESNSWIEFQQAAVNSVSLKGTGSLEELLKQLLDIENIVIKNRDQLDKLEQCDQVGGYS
ncbi:unnamed protein product [Protopolystoma xenopodis]|uniref:Uncharacterized protein n=1 Tax=Protopolystoma xenopodis TaxID=117903 RepID=A0A3S5CVP2_9PLAT|nr:unnamed protein product [Protopolystoma xenopodis]